MVEIQQKYGLNSNEQQYLIQSVVITKGTWKLQKTLNIIVR